MLLKYLKYRAKAILLVLIIICLSAVSSLLFQVPVPAVLYPLILSAVISIMAGIIDFAGFCRKHRLLTMPLPADQDALPKPSNLIDEDYLAIIEKLKEEETAFRHQAASDYSNMVDYYTIWAHQIKTPIASMRLSLQSEDSEQARKLIGDLNRIEAYVEMVLTFLRLNSDSTDYIIKEHDLDEIIRSSVRKFSRDFILKKLSLDFRPTDFTVLTDEKWLSFIIEQIVSNAVKYTAHGSVSIYMDEPGCLCIKDTGIGIAPEDLPRIFENGYTGFNGREDRRASGIGLYLCKRTADNLGHGILAESTPGMGTTITFDLRRQDLSVE